MIRQHHPNKATLSIGDGANDVSMITEANIGVGIQGNEGNQAVSSSDYALSRFKDLKPLLLFHGREAYRRNSYLIYYMFYKNLLLNSPIIYFGLYSAFSGQVFFDAIMSQIFNLVFTSWPILIFATHDEEYTRETFLRNPFLYSDGPKNVHMNGYQFWNWAIFTIYQSALLFYIVFIASANDPATLYQGKDQPAAILTDMWLLGILLYFIVICMVNN